MPGCNTVEERMLDAQHEAARKVLVDACVKHYAESLHNSPTLCLRVAYEGFKGFISMSTEELIRYLNSVAFPESTLTMAQSPPQERLPEMLVAEFLSWRRRLAQDSALRHSREFMDWANKHSDWLLGQQYTEHVDELLAQVQAELLAQIQAEQKEQPS